MRLFVYLKNQIVFVQLLLFILFAGRIDFIFGASPSLGDYNVYYGLLHNHSNVSGSGTPAVGSPDSAYKYAKNTAHLDFFGLADHAGDISSTEWDQIKTAADAYNQDGFFISFRGFEWSSDEINAYGHVAVINTDDYCTESQEITNTFVELCQWLSTRNGVAFFNHPRRFNQNNNKEFELFTTTPSNKFVGMELWNRTDPFSKYYYNNGYYSNDNNRSYYDEAISRGWKIGAAGSEDNHTANWGTATNYRLAILANNLTRDSLLAALRARRFFSTLDKNLALSFKVDNMEMGSTITSGSSVIQVQAIDGNGEFFSKVMLFNKNHDTVNTWSLNTPSVNVSYTLNTTDSNYFYVKITQADGDEAISSPVWVIPNKPPSCNITTPANGATFIAPAVINISANAVDTDGSISKVQFYSNSGLLGEDATSPYEYTWTGVGAGLFALTAVAIDNRRGTTTSSTISITVNVPPNQPPLCALTAPANNAIFVAPASVSISADASDPDGTISKVGFYSNGSLLAENAGAPYTFAWTSVAAGTYAITAIATDNAGATTTSSPISITVNAPPNQPPLCAITAPANNAIFVAPASVSISADASDPDGTISKVGFYSNGSLLAENAGAPYTFAWTSVAAGTYAITAIATDNAGATTTSSPISITVNAPPNQPPLCAITAPANNAIFVAPASVSISADASDPDGTISKVGFYSNGSLLAENAGAPYTFAWTSVAAGTYAITAIATDNAGATTTSSPISITVNAPPNQPPLCAIAAPANNAIFVAPASVSISADASDPDGTISKVGFYSNGSLLAEDAGAPYAYDDWTNVAAGTYAITAIATDNAGATTTSSPISITVNAPPNQPPLCAITAPANNAIFVAPASVSISADASDPDGTISKVGFYSNGSLLAENAGAPYTFAWTSVAAGTYAITAIATDNAGATTTSSPISITVNAPPNQPPLCAIAAPANNAIFVAPASVSISADASDPDGTISKVGFYSNGSLLAENAGAPYTFAWTSVAAGTYAITAIATDNAGATTTSSPISITVNAPPNQPPLCAITAPANNAIFVAPASVSISADASDPDGTISKVGFYSNGSLLAENAGAPYTFAWTSVAAGTYAITAIATDNSGATTTSSPIPITVNTPPNQPPLCALTAPANNAIFVAPASVSISADASDPDGSISNVAFYSNGGLLFEDASAPYAYDWTNVAAGTYAITAIATDNSGATTTSSLILITVNIPNPPTLVFPIYDATEVSLVPVLSWNKGKNVRLYNAQLSSDSSFITPTIDSLLGDTSLSIAHDVLMTNKRYFWRIRISDYVNSSAWSEIGHFSTMQSVPNQVLLLAPIDTAKALDSVFFTWSKASPVVDRYELEIATDSLMSNIFLSDSLLTDTVSLQKGFANKKAYWWRIKAHNISGWGSYSKNQKIAFNVPSTAITPNRYLHFFKGMSNSRSVLTYGLPTASNVSIRLFSMQGKLIQTVINSYQIKGSYKIPILCTGLSKGCYIIHFKTDTYSLHMKISNPF